MRIILIIVIYSSGEPMLISLYLRWLLLLENPRIELQHSKQVHLITRSLGVGTINIVTPPVYLWTSCVCVPQEMWINVTAFGLPILLTSQQRERESEGGKKPIEKRLGIKYFQASIEQVGKSSDIYSNFARTLNSYFFI